MTDYQLLMVARHRAEEWDDPYDADLLRELTGRYEEIRSERDEAVRDTRGIQNDLNKRGRTVGRVSNVYRAEQAAQDNIRGQAVRIGQIMGVIDGDDQDDQIQRMIAHLDHAVQSLHTAAEEVGDAALAASGSVKAQEECDGL